MVDIYFVILEDVKEWVLKMGEDESYVFNMGCLLIDIVYEV